MKDTIDEGRRHAMRMMAAMGAGALVGAGWTYSALAAEQVSLDLLELPPVTLPPRSIDVHTHFFNASDASVKGYFLNSQLHSKPKLQRLATYFQGLLDALVTIAPTAREEMDDLTRLYAQKLSPPDMEAVFDLREFSQRSKIAKAIARQMRDTGMDKEFGRGFETDKGFVALPQDEQEIRALLDPDGIDDNKAMGFGLADINVPGFFRFMGSMLQYRWMTLRAYRRGHERRGISAAFGAMVDFDYFYPDAHRSPLADQVELHSMLSRLSRGFMLPLMAYNPWSDIKSGGARLRLLTEAVEQKGFIGAKIYPPVGFKPYGNTTAPQGLDVGDLNKALRAFFIRCSDLGIPVMAHANSTQGRDAAADQNSGPEGWIALIAEMATEHKVPVLNLGHFGGNGGEGGGDDGESNDWPVRFARIMRDKGGERVYGDLGNWSELRGCHAGDLDCTPLRRLADARNEFPGLVNHLMYGSDYFMMIKAVDWKRWPEDIARAMTASGFDANRLFHQNAMECFGLLPGGANRARLETFFAGKLPAWMA